MTEAGATMRRDWKPIVWALVVGMLAGAGLMRTFCPHSSGSHRGMVARLIRDLRLDDAQRAKLDQILEAKRQKLEAVRTETRPRFREIHDAVRLEIRALLTPEQQAKFDKIEADWKARREKRRVEEGKR